MESRLWNRDNSVKVKICGVKSIEFAYDCYELGISALGYHLWRQSGDKSFNEDTVTAHSKIIRLLPSDITSILVTTVADVKDLITIQKKCRYDTIQLHLQLSSGELSNIIGAVKNEFDVKIIGVISMTQEEHKYGFNSLFEYYTKDCDAIILDKSWHGGTGLTYDWKRAEKLITTCIKPVLIAGGINVGNIKDAYTQLKPYGFDIESGAERKIGSNRIKSTIKTASLLNALEINHTNPPHLI